MKKILALVLALVLVVCATAALASSPSAEEVKPSADTKTDSGTQTNSSTNSGSTYVSVRKKSIEVVLSKDNDATAELIKQLTEAGKDKVLSVIPEEINLPEDYTAVNEISTWKIEGDIEDVNSAEVTFDFPTPYPVGDTVYLLIYTSDGEWLSLQGKADKEGKVVVAFSKETLTKLGNNPFVVVAVSKA